MQIDNGIALGDSNYCPLLKIYALKEAVNRAFRKVFVQSVRLGSYLALVSILIPGETENQGFISIYKGRCFQYKDTPNKVKTFFVMINLFTGKIHPYIETSPGPISRTIFHRNSNSMENWF